MQRLASLKFRVFVECNEATVIKWLLNKGSFARALPPTLNYKYIKREELSSCRRQVIFTLRPFFFNRKWKVIFFNPKKNTPFKLIQEKGLFASFVNLMDIRLQGDNAVEILDTIEYSLKFPWFFPKIRQRKIERFLESVLKYKHRVMINDLKIYQKYSSHYQPMRILVAGSHGMIGSHLTQLLLSFGHDVYILERKKEGCTDPQSIYFNLETGEGSYAQLEGFDAVINLVGSSIYGRWSEKKKEKMLNSRIESTRNLVRAFTGLAKPPKLFVSASAIGYYGNAKERVVDEHSSKGEDSFFANLCEQWESSCDLLRSRNIRAVQLRFGSVLSPSGGMLKKLLPYYRIGLGGVVGDGSYHMSWISLDDAAYAIYHTIVSKSVSGPLNITAPFPVRGQGFSEELSIVLQRNLGPTLPLFLVRLFKGEIVDEVLTLSSYVEPRQLLESGFEFSYPKLTDALKHQLL